MSQHKILNSDILSSQLQSLPNIWQNAPKRWGHPLHSLCSYFAMFPPHIPRIFIEWLTAKGDVVYDPFSGRGTAPLEACRLGRVGLGSDANPLAYVLTSAKVNPPNKEDILQRLDELALGMPSRRRQRPPKEIKMLYSPKVLRQLCWLREELNYYSKVDCFIAATILGIMHANYKYGSPARGLSISMPNTFSMSPNYVEKYIAEHDLKPPDEDVLDMVRRKLDKLNLPSENSQRGRAWESDARFTSIKGRKAKLIFTSPPYLGVIKYGKYNWIRLWFLGYEPKEVDKELVSTSSQSKYLSFMSDVLLELKNAVREDGYVCLMIGDVKLNKAGDSLNLAKEVWEHSAKPLGWRKLGVVIDQLPEHHKVSRIWGHKKKGKATKIDRILILAPPSSNHNLPLLNLDFSWENAECWSEIQFGGNK